MSVEDVEGVDCHGESWGICALAEGGLVRGGGMGTKLSALRGGQELKEVKMGEGYIASWIGSRYGEWWNWRPMRWLWSCYAQAVDGMVVGST